MDLDFVVKLKQALDFPLPGREAQSMMSPGQRDAYYHVPQNHNTACVLVLLFPKNNKWNITLIERNSHTNDKHSGQIGFPGGKLEESDADFQSCALREAEEEIGINKEQVEVIGKLSELYVFVSNYNVHPFVGFSQIEPDFKLQASEVRSLLTFPLEHFLNESNISQKDISVRNMVIKDVPYFDLEGHILWGATAMMMSEFIHVLKSIP